VGKVRFDTDFCIGAPRDSNPTTLIENVNSEERSATWKQHAPVVLPWRKRAYQELRHVCENGALFCVSHFRSKLVGPTSKLVGPTRRTGAYQDLLCSPRRTAPVFFLVGPTSKLVDPTSKLVGPTRHTGAYQDLCSCRRTAPVFSGRPNVKAGRPNVEAGRPNAPHGVFQDLCSRRRTAPVFVW